MIELLLQYQQSGKCRFKDDKKTKNSKQTSVQRKEFQAYIKPFATKYIQHTYLHTYMHTSIHTPEINF